MPSKFLLLLLTLFFSTTQVNAATLLTMSGGVTFENYGANPSPLSAAASSIAIAITFDDEVAPNADITIGDAEIALYNSAILATRIDIFDIGGVSLGRIDPLDATISMGYQPSTGNSEMVFASTFAPTPDSPFVELDLIFFGINMFENVSLLQITQGRLDFANQLSEGDLETELDTFEINGIGFDIDLGSLSVTRNVPAPTPVPAPPAILGLFAGLLGLGLVARREGRGSKSSSKEAFNA